MARRRAVVIRNPAVALGVRKALRALGVKFDSKSLRAPRKKKHKKKRHNRPKKKARKKRARRRMKRVGTRRYTA